MAIVIQNDIWSPVQTSQTKGFQDRNDSRAIRVASLLGLSNSDASTQEAIDAYKAEIGDFHHNDTTLPLFSIRAYRYGLDKAFAVARFDHGRGFSFPQQPADRLVRIVTGLYGVSWFRKPFVNGSPNTPVFTTNRPSGSLSGIINPEWPSWEPEPYVWKVPIIDVYVNTELDFDPTQDVALLQENTNIDAIRWGSFEFPPNTVRFNGAIVDYIETALGIRFQVQYHFTARRGGWVSMFTIWDTTTTQGQDTGAGTDFQWDTELADDYERATFNGAFPVHA